MNDGWSFVLLLITQCYYNSMLLQEKAKKHCPIIVIQCRRSNAKQQSKHKAQNLSSTSNCKLRRCRMPLMALIVMNLVHQSDSLFISPNWLKAHMGVFWQILAVEPKRFDELFRQTDGKFLIAVKIRLRQISVLTYVCIIFRSYYCIYLLTTPVIKEVGVKSKNMTMA